MNYNDHFQLNVPPQNGVDSTGFWPQFPVSNEQFQVNSQIIDDQQVKKAKNFDDDQAMSQNNRRSPPVNPQSTGRIFFKTRHCAKFRMGQCKNGENCNFAHGDEDLRKPPPNWQELVSGRSDERGGRSNGNGNGSENWEDDDSIIHKMKLCKRYYNGEECPYGERCNFLHKDPPRFNRDVAPPPRFRDSSRESAAISIGTTGPPPMAPPQVADQFEVNRTAGNVNGNVDAARGNVDAARGNVKPVYWKTRLCTRFEMTAYCPFGDSCHYAHGQAELLLPGGRPADAEQTIVGSMPLKQVAQPSTDPTPVNAENGSFQTDQDKANKIFLKWSSKKKINRIYGDWLDDMPLIMPNGDER